MANFFTWQFWFDMRPGQLMPLYKNVLIIIIIILIVLSVYFFIKKKNFKRKRNYFVRTWKQLYYCCTTNALLGILLLFFNYEMIPILSSRFIFPLWGILLITWILFIYKNHKKVKERIQHQDKDKNLKQYLP